MFPHTVILSGIRNSNVSESLANKSRRHVSKTRRDSDVKEPYVIVLVL